MNEHKIVTCKNEYEEELRHMVGEDMCGDGEGNGEEV